MSGRDDPPPDPAADASEGFLARWSRRKREGAPEEDASPARPVAEAAPPAERIAGPSAARDPGQGILGRLLRRAAAPNPPTVTLPEIDLATLPSIESLTAQSDITVFLQRGIPVALRNAALRRAWSLDPAIRDFVGPADYAWDYNAPDGVPGFALDLGGADLKQLLAQAFGARDAPQGEAARERPEDGASAEAESPAIPPDPDAEPPPEMLAEAPRAPDPAAPVIPTTPTLAPSPPDGETGHDPPPQSNRHGGALPA